MKDKKITIKFKVPSLTKNKIHTVVIEDKDLFDTWTSVDLDVGLRDGNYTHDLNAWADSLGHIDFLRVSVYPFIKDEKGQNIETDYDAYIRCVVVSVKGDPNITAYKCGKNGKRWGYVRKNIQSFV